MTESPLDSTRRQGERPWSNEVRDSRAGCDSRCARRKAHCLHDISPRTASKSGRRRDGCREKTWCEHGETPDVGSLIG